MDAIWLILILGGVTFLTRSSGYLIVAQFGKLHPRVLAALNSVPAAVLITIVVQPVIEGGIPERTAMLVALLAGLRFSIVPTLLVGLAVLSLLRYML